MSQQPYVRIPSHKPCGQPEPSAWRGPLAANQMEMNLHMTPCWFVHVSMAAVASFDVFRLLPHVG